jgi:hypothetical protein
VGPQKRQRFVVGRKETDAGDVRRVVGVALAGAGLEPRRDVVVDDGHILRPPQRCLEGRRGEGDQHVGAAGHRRVNERRHRRHVALRVEDLHLEVTPVLETGLAKAIEHPALRILHVDHVVVLHEVDLPGVLLRQSVARGALAMLKIGKQQNDRRGGHDGDAESNPAKSDEHGRRVWSSGGRKVSRLPVDGQTN